MQDPTKKMAAWKVKKVDWDRKKSAYEKKNKSKAYSVKKPAVPVLKRALLLAGPCGIGKSCSMYLVCKEAGYKLFTFAPEDDQMTTKVNPITQSTFYKKTCVVVDGVDHMSGRPALIDVMKKSLLFLSYVFTTRDMEQI